jgi:hypothetical protein
VGYYGRGLVDDGSELQGQLDELQEKVADLFSTQSMPLVAVQEKDAALLNQLSALRVRCVKYQNAPPERIVDAVVHPQVLQREETLKQDVFEQLGTNMLSAAGRRPEGLSSGKALRDFRNISVERFKTPAKNMDHFVMQLGLAIEDEASRLEARGFKVVLDHTPGMRVKRGRGAHDWSKVRDRRGDFALLIEVASSTSKALSGRNSDLQDLFNSGAVGRERFLQNFHAPDLKAFLRRETSLADLSDVYVSKIREGVAEDLYPVELPPEAMQYLAREITLEYARAVAEDEPDSVLEGFGVFLSRLQAITKRQQEELLAQAAAAQQAAVARAPTPEAAGSSILGAEGQAPAPDGEPPPA